MGLDIALRDHDVPKKYILKGEPLRYMDTSMPDPGTLHLVARFGSGVGGPSWPHKCHSWFSLPATQLCTNGGSRRVMLSWTPGDDIKYTRLTAPVETVRMASLPQSYLSWVRSFSRDDSFLHQCVNAGVPLRTGTAIIRSVVDTLERIGAPRYCPGLNVLAVATTMSLTDDESGELAEIADSGGIENSGGIESSGGLCDNPYIMSELMKLPTMSEEPGNFCFSVHQTVAELVNPEPKTFKQVLLSPDKDKWIEAINKEMNSICNDKMAAQFQFKRGLPKGAKLLPSKLVLKHKPETGVAPARYKARLVCGGHRQTTEDYEEIFSPVVRFTTIRTLLALTALNNWSTAQFDVECAFLNAPIEEEVYIRIPDGCTQLMPKGMTTENGVLKILKAVYGLKQSPRNWNQELHKLLTSLKFQQSQVDHCLYSLKVPRVVKGKTTGTSVVYLTVYVDDVALFGDSELIKWVVSKVAQTYAITDQGELRDILGVEIHRKGSSILINQERFIQKILKTFSMDTCNPTKLPCTSEMKLTKDMEAKTEEEKKQMATIPYRSLVGSILYLQLTRPDIAYAVKELSRFLINPGPKMWAAAKNVLRYLKGTSTHGIQFGGRSAYNTSATSPSHLVGFSDSDWAGQLDDRKSTSGTIFYLNNGAISFASKTQKCVALSTAESEYIALGEAAREAIYLRMLLKDLGHEQKEPTVIFEDNIAAEKLSKNNIQHGRTKHIDIKHHFIREVVQSKQIEIKHIASSEMLADILTKALAFPIFNKLRQNVTVPK